MDVSEEARRIARMDAIIRGDGTIEWEVSRAEEIEKEIIDKISANMRKTADNPLPTRR